MTSNLHLCAIARAPINLRVNGTKLSEEAKKEMLERSIAGEHFELDMDAVVFIQRDEPNGNFFRFAPKIMKKLARSATGVPFLLDHKQHDSLSRGGTVVASRAYKNDSGEWVITQTLNLVKPWAVQGALDGTIDRFSIGALPTGPIVYRHNGETVLGAERRWPEFFPGDETEYKGKNVTVEYVVTEAKMIETSGVNVPAVEGTGPEGFRAALSALFGNIGLPKRSGDGPQKEKRVMKNLMLRLGLTADASEVSALKAYDSIVANAESAEKQAAATKIELSAERMSHEETRKRLAVFEASEKVRKEGELGAKIEALYEVGKLSKSRDAQGVELADAMEATLRETHAKCGAAVFDRIALGLASKVPVAVEKQSASAVVPSPKLAVSERQRKMNAQMGMDDQKFEANLNKGGSIPTNYQPVTVGGKI